MKKGILACLLSIIIPQFSLGQSHEDEFPEGTLLALEGKDAVTRKDCALYVMDVGFKGSEQTNDQFYAVVKTSYSHGSDQPDQFIVQFNSQNSSVLIGLGQNQKDQIAIMTTAGSQDLRQAQSFNLRWFHNNHFDNFRCTQLKVHEH